MDDRKWMLKDGSGRAVIWAFRTREHAEAWQEEFLLRGFRPAPLHRGDGEDGLTAPAGGSTA